MTTGFWLVSRWWGLLWLCFSLLAPAARVYFGLHYPGDIFAGALIGITITIAINNEFVRHRIALPMLIFEKQAPLFSMVCCFHSFMKFLRSSASLGRFVTRLFISS